MWDLVIDLNFKDLKLETNIGLGIVPKVVNHSYKILKNK